MYLDNITITQLRVFEQAELKLWYPGRKAPKEETPTLPNVNVLLGNNGAGKSTLLKAIGLAALGPMGEKFDSYRMVRRVAGEPAAKGKVVKKSQKTQPPTTVQAVFQRTWQDNPGEKLKPNDRLKTLRTQLVIERQIDQEYIRPDIGKETAWGLMNQDDSPAFLTVGYGATRRTDTDTNAATPQQRLRSMPLRHQRLGSLFYDNYTLIPLHVWLPQLEKRNKGRFTQVINRLNEVMPDGLEITTERSKADEFMFRQHGASVPFAALSDGPRAFIGWVADLLYHICFGCPDGVKLVDNCGLVLVDEIDLLLHPEWQRTVVPKLAKTFPKLQFVFTTHSPIVVGSVQRMNLWICEPTPEGNATDVSQRDIGVHGLNSDHILLTPYFGMTSTRADEKQKELDTIAASAERQTPGKALEFLKSLVTPLDEKPGAVSKVAGGAKPRSRTAASKKTKSPFRKLK
jgi:predicted ATPase